MSDHSGDAELDRLYREIVLAHYREPRHREPLVDPDGSGHAQNRICGDAVDVDVRIRSGRIEAVSARALGCSIAVAATSVLADVILGRPSAESQRLAAQLADAVQGRELPTGAEVRLRAFAAVARLPARQRCALPAGEALAQALERAGAGAGPSGA